MRYLLPLFLAASLQAIELPSDLHVLDNITYKQVGDAKLELLLCQPTVKKFEKSPLVVYIHGGGWGSGDRYKAILRRDLIDVVRQLNLEGITVASIEYRLAKGEGSTAYDAVADCKDAVRFLANNAEKYDIDPERIGTFGSSAGGHLTLVTALGRDSDYPCDPKLAGSPPKIRCVAAYYPLVSFIDQALFKGSNFERPQRLIPLLGGTLEEKRDIATKLSPLELLSPASPPIFVAHGDADKVISSQNATALRDAAQAEGVPVECFISKGAGHGFGGDAIDPGIPEINRQTIAFFLKHLTQP